jgi:hypothetical protein
MFRLRSEKFFYFTLKEIPKAGEGLEPRVARFFLVQFTQTGKMLIG